MDARLREGTGQRQSLWPAARAAVSLPRWLVSGHSRASRGQHSEGEKRDGEKNLGGDGLGSCRPLRIAQVSGPGIRCQAALLGDPRSECVTEALCTERLPVWFPAPFRMHFGPWGQVTCTQQKCPWTGMLWSLRLGCESGGPRGQLFTVRATGEGSRSGQGAAEGQCEFPCPCPGTCSDRGPARLQVAGHQLPRLCP